MHTLIREVQKQLLKRVPEVRTGYTVKVSQKIKEGGKERVQHFEGLVIKVGHGEGVEKTITVRKIVQGIGVEKVFPIHSPNITKIEVKKKAKVRRAKLYYMRERSGKSARLQERQVTEAERVAEEEKMESMVQEAVKADEERKAEEAKHAPDSDPGAEGAVETAEGAPETDTQTTETPEEPAAKPDAEPAEAGEGLDAGEGTEGAEAETSEPAAKEESPEAEESTDAPEDDKKTEEDDTGKAEEKKEEEADK